ncbi:MULTISPECIES: LuxR C-terminal-related transcriptional regulator [unclassified Serratia (in: enterobacteria)]|uniref:helix-turn-helix transcriptional regulator n=1 Tax=unclassified Serratia (in: enterobacteria) TaxID=2647522 RepID=UPI00046933EF|nr:MULTISPECIES: LuxR C-terminal-related transcriptional regulator [unclassified Serratia (in: enterobacteria)]
MISLKRDRVVVVSPCCFFQAGIWTLLTTHSLSRVWHCQKIAEAQRYLAAQPVDMVVMSLHIGQQADLLLALRFIQQVRLSFPGVVLMVTLDVPIPYLVTRLCRLGVRHILRLGQPLGLWQAQLRQMLLGEGSRVGSDLPGCDEETLSMAERQVVEYLIQGKTLAEIAALTSRSIKTISTQKGQAMHKLGIRHYAQLIAVQSIFVDSWLSHDRRSVAGGATPRLWYYW